MRYLLVTADKLRPVAARPYDDAYIERWGAVYRANPQIQATGYDFDAFLAQPEAILSAAIYHTLVPLPDGHRFYPLLPAQRAVQERVDAEAAGQLSLPFATINAGAAATSGNGGRADQAAPGLQSPLHNQREAAHG